MDMRGPAALTLERPARLRKASALSPKTSGYDLGVGAVAMLAELKIARYRGTGRSARMDDLSVAAVLFLVVMVVFGEDYR
jgi:hypothetical protein